MGKRAFIVRYPRFIKLRGGDLREIREEELRRGPLAALLLEEPDRVRSALLRLGFKKTRLEVKKRGQSGCGLVRELHPPWELHLRIFRDGLGATIVKGEVEVSRRYLEHLWGGRAPVIYEVLDILRGGELKPLIRDDTSGEMVEGIFAGGDYELKLLPPRSLICWKPLLVAGVGLGIFLGAFRRNRG